jgi:hypothetical protein
MDAKEKAKQLVDKFTDVEDGEMYIGKAKKCALIAVMEIINSNPHSNPLNTEVFSTIYYWHTVKREIEKR